MKKEDIQEIKRLRELVLTIDIRENVNHQEIQEIKESLRILNKSIKALMQGVIKDENY